MLIRSFVAWHNSQDVHGGAPPPAELGPGWRYWHNAGLTVWYAPRDGSQIQPLKDAALPELVLGDDAEWRAGAPDATLAAGVPIRYDPMARALVISTSIVALPPVFRLHGPVVCALASDVGLLSSVPSVGLELDPSGVRELGWFGHPVEHRTLFRGVDLVEAGLRLTLAHDGSLTSARAWRLPDGVSLAWNAFIELQIEAFRRAVARLDLSRTFLSLTAGLDTRTVLAVLTEQARLVPTVTMTGPRLSLDARTAGRLSTAYGMSHRRVVFDERFIRALPALVERASRLSGGLASLAQASEVFLYEEMGGDFASRLSGNLGNQVGRGGTEGVSIRGADLTVLAPRFRDGTTLPSHWMLERLSDPRSALQFILGSEIAVASVGNYTIGNHFAAQQSPYADRALIETLASRPLAGGSNPSHSKLRMRVRDIAHRFAGEPEKVSFQRSLVRRIGGPVADIPVNWGWRPAGGIAIGGAAVGALAMAGMVARARGFDDGPIGRVVAITGLPALHDFRESRRWLRHLSEFTRDTLGSRSVRDAELFDRNVLEHAVGAFFDGRGDHFETITFALDLALAHRLTR